MPPKCLSDGEEGARVRAFLAIPFRADEHRLLKSLQEALAAMPALGDFRWAKPENMHVTLRFLGEVGEERAEAAAEALRRAALDAPAFDVPLERFGVFPHLRRPGVLWAGPAETPAPLANLEARLSRHLAEAGFPAVEERRLRAHVTLARRRVRARPPAGLEGELEVAERRWLTPPPALRAREAALFRSELLPSGAIHAALARAPLGQAEAGRGGRMMDIRTSG